MALNECGTMPFLQMWQISERNFQRFFQSLIYVLRSQVMSFQHRIFPHQINIFFPLFGVHK